MNLTIKTIFLFAMLVFLFSGCEKAYVYENGKIAGINSIAELDNAAVFSFAIMSDNKGDSPGNKKEFANMVEWIEQNDDRFVIGLGDHVKKGWENSFLDFLKENQWWHDNFYPNVADGENEFYGESQADWGAGAPILDEVNLDSRKNVIIRDNKCEYYARIEVEGYTIHLIQLHYSDSPKEDSIAFNEDTRNFLLKTLNGIEKGKKDIIIVGAHSRKGFWIDKLSDEQKQVVMEKCDLALSATTHFFERKVVEGYENTGPLFINTGSITHASSYCPNGYVQVHVFKKPMSLVVQYYDATRSERELRHSEYVYIKVIGGEILSTDFTEPRPKEDMDRVVGALDRNFSKEEMSAVAESLFIALTGADEAYIVIESGLKKGNVVYRDLWSVFDFNNEIFMLTLHDADIKKVFGDKLPMDGRKEIKLAINSWYASYIIGELELPEERIVKAGKKEIDVLEDWVSSFN